jgi:signal transduction histidine kinase
MRRAGLVAACALTAIVVAEAAAFRATGPTPDALPLPERLIAVLIATALLLVATLALPRIPALAWATTTLAAAIAVVEVMAAVRSLETVASGTAWLDLSALAATTLVAGASIGIAYAVRDLGAAGPITRGWLLVAAAGLIATVATSIWAVAQAGARVEAGQLSPLRTAVRIGLATIAAGFLIGAGRDLGPRVRVAYRESAVAGPAAGGRLWRFAGILADGLLPGRAAGRRVAAESERARLAADLHALVLPELRRAAASAEAAGMPAEVQVDLRRALEDVEQLMLERQSVVLEQFGLVAALEWLAERTEERSRLRVELALDGSVPDRPDAVDPAVARAAFRIALLALDNVVRHADATIATVRLSMAASGLRLHITDDGTPSTEPAGQRGRGIVDMRAAALQTGASLDIAFDAGTRVDVAWPPRSIPANHATPARETADRSGAAEP